MKFDIIVIGKGLIGSAAAKYISRTNLKVAIIGPDEPANYEDAEVFASHYDSGRVFRQIGKNEAMTNINLQAHKEYPVLEQESGIIFQKKNGCLYVNPKGQDAYLSTVEQRATTHGIEFKMYKNGNAIRKDFPSLSFPETSQGFFERNPSGHINPKLLIEAQLKVVEKNKGIVIREVVKSVNYTKEAIFIKTGVGNVFSCKKVIFAMGAFTNYFGLIKKELDLTLKSETVILAQLGIAEVERLKKLPSLLYELDIPEIEGIYATQPIQYPDGHYYLKMGANLPADSYFRGDLEAIKAWFANGDSNGNIRILEKHLQTLFPDLKTKKVLSKRCILTRTNHQSENPFIGKLEKGRSYLAVGNGWCGGNSDGAGYIVANLAMEGQFPEGFFEIDFNPVYID